MGLGVAANRINFDVMVLQSGRWEVHGSYPQDRQGQAIKDAKALENISTIQGVKVIREEIDGDTGAARENNIYASSNLAAEQPKGAQKAKLARGNSQAANKSVQKKGEQKGKSRKSGGHNMRPGAAIPKHVEAYDPDAAAEAATFSFFRLMVKLLMVVLFSAIIAFIVSSLGGIWLSATKFGAAAQANILNALFFGTFFLSVVWMSFSFLSKAKIARPRRNHPPRKQKPPPLPLQPAPSEMPDNTIDFGDETNKMTEQLGNTGEMRQSLQGGTGETADQASPTDAEPGGGVEEIGVKKEDTPWVKTQKAFVMAYLVESLKNANSEKIVLDNFNKFGVNLFVAGAIETLGRSRNLDGKTTSRILGEAVKYMGFRGRDAEAFPDKIQGYLLADSKYMQMYQAGRSSMMSHLESDAEGTSTLAAALTEWNKPKLADQATGPITVLFTDIAGSTHMTQNLGDALAQQVVRAHNKIVRDALHKFSGKEVKHTGDGIMASFAITSNGVEAATEMQARAREHNIANPDLPLDLKIGINAGEPIAEEDDLFGITVQLAARIVDKAQAGQIFVSEIIRALCEGKNIDFVERGSFAMKGIDGDITLYEVIWNPDAVPTAIEAEKESGKNESGPEIGSEIGADRQDDKTGDGAAEQATTDTPEGHQPAAADAPEAPVKPVAAQPSSEAPIENETTPDPDDPVQTPAS